MRLRTRHILDVAVFPASTAQALLATFAKLGLATPPLWQALGPMADQLPDEAFERLWAAAVAQAGSDSLELDVAGALQAGSFGPFDLSAITSPTVGAACLIIARHVTHLMGTGVELAVERRPRAGVRLQVLNTAPANAEVADVLVLGSLVRRLSAHSTTRFTLTGVQLTRAAPARRDRWETFFGATVRFGARASSLEFPAEVWRAPLASANPAVHRALAPLLPSVTEDGWLDSVRAHVRHHLTDAQTLGRVAGALGLSERTLQRRLRAAKTTLRRVVAEVRVQEATRLLQGSMTLSEVAAQVGFSTASALSRALAANRR